MALVPLAESAGPAPAALWDPAQYGRFSAERAQPFEDLLALCSPVPGGSVVDLGCGTGELTALAHRRLDAKVTTGLDRSAEMLTAVPVGVPGLGFVQGDIADWEGDGVDLVLANASLHWLSDHEGLLARLRASLAPGGQLAFQVPANFSHPSHRVARSLAAEAPFAALQGRGDLDRATSVLSPNRYAEILHALGAVAQHVRLQVYGHELASLDEVVEWVKGTFLGPYRAALGPAAFAAFLGRYRARLGAELGDPRPYFYAFSRIVCWARFDGAIAETSFVPTSDVDGPDVDGPTAGRP
jgi:trans-aconitate 2-methyltransferase